MSLLQRPSLFALVTSLTACALASQRDDPRSSLDASFVWEEGKVTLSGSHCVSEAGTSQQCTGEMVLMVDGPNKTAPIRLSKMLLDSSNPLHVGVIDQSVNSRSPSIVISDFDADGIEDVAVAVDRQGGYGRTSYAFFLRRGANWQQSPEFEALTAGRLGLPIRSGNTLTANGKSGCCEHWEETYRIEDGLPVVSERTTHYSLPDGTTNVETIRGDKARARASGDER